MIVDFFLLAGKSYACRHIFYTPERYWYYRMEDFGVPLAGQSSLIFDVMACTDVSVLLMKDRNDFYNQVYEITIGNQGVLNLFQER